LAACAGIAPGQGSALPGTCPGADAWPPSIGARATAEALRCLVNEERVAEGLAPLADEPRARRAAGAHAHDMARRGFFGHLAPAPAPVGRTPQRRADAAGVGAMVDEAIHRGPATPRAAVFAWLASHDHCAVLMAPAGTGLGAAAVPAGRAGQVWTLLVTHRRATARRGAEGVLPACGRHPRARPAGEPIAGQRRPPPGAGTVRTADRAYARYPGFRVVPRPRGRPAGEGVVYSSARR
jgi:uncharacterized protein YkwD